MLQQSFPYEAEVHIALFARRSYPNTNDRSTGVTPYYPRLYVRTSIVEGR